ncbi:chaplin [Streptomyces montanus]|uniref:Chaplin n=1 Tax=Streptomyces montanus TaxID=2580423 RepID=A0A5R9FRC3_9ACTN|nr:chaplin [Streptomyces montanus]TLS43383.1 chaplin [Streptomyces montanus]
MTAEKGKHVKHKKSAAVVAGVIMAMGMAAPAVADSGADGAADNSPGVGSGNVVQVPINVPIEACGNTISITGLLNPALSNTCLNG